ncbi:Hypothetical Protein XCAW_03055 [Xanthomonas citri subsp. citri Aw12879]|nr:Hypothetical Protein XCAW_03055 [Xanthomonas citri subsp. citri Aw12879]
MAADPAVRLPQTRLENATNAAVPEARLARR